MAYLTQTGVISYNGYSLQGPRNSVQLQIVPVYDSTNRRITHSRLIFAIDGWLTSDFAGVTGDGSDTKTHMETIRGAWSQSGGILIVTGFGFGDVYVNSSSQNRDVNFGPKPQPLEMRNIGNGCIVLVWAIEAEIKICQNGGLSGIIGRVREYVYNVRWSIKPNGCTVRTVEGHLETFLNSSTAHSSVTRGNRITESADNYRDLVEIPIQPGFYRSHPQEYKLSENKQRLYFKVQDEEPESDNAYPPGVASMRLENGVTSDLFGQGANFTVQEAWFSGEIEMARPYSVKLGWERVLLIMKERLVHAFNGGLAPMITYISISESLFERRVNFVVRYRLIGSSMDKLISGTGLFTKVTSTNHGTYVQSMQLAWANRGTAKLQFDAAGELLADGCYPNERITIIDKIAPYFLNGGIGGMFLRCPAEKDSYLVYQNYVSIDGKSDNINIPNMATSFAAATIGYASGALAGILGRTGRNATGVRAKSGQKIQTIGNGSLRKRITIRGMSYRIGFVPEIPSASLLLGKTPGFVIADNDQEITVAGFYGECYIYAMSWYHTFDTSLSEPELNSALLSVGLNSLVLETQSVKDPKKKKSGI